MTAWFRPSLRYLSQPALRPNANKLRPDIPPRQTAMMSFPTQWRHALPWMHFDVDVISARWLKQSKMKKVHAGLPLLLISWGEAKSSQHRATLVLIHRASQRTQHLELLHVYICCQTVFLLCSHKSDSIHLQPPSSQRSSTDMLQIDHDTLENRQKMWEGGRVERREIRKMFSLAAEQRIRADGFRKDGWEEKKRNGLWLDKIRTGGVKEYLTPV